MHVSLRPGLVVDFTYLVPEEKVVAGLLPEAPEFQAMPRVLATGFLVGLCEWACIRALRPHLDWPREQTVGIAVDLSHSAPTPPGMTVRICGELERVEGRRLWFGLEARDGRDLIGRGRHQRYVIDYQAFSAKAAAKLGR